MSLSKGGLGAVSLVESPSLSSDFVIYRCDPTLVSNLFDVWVALLCQQNDRIECDVGRS